jgi:hypothetical protein
MTQYTYLELCRKLAREALVTQSTTVPSAVTGQTGQLYRLIEWVRDAWVDVQNRHDDWRWMRRAFTLNTVSGDDSYAYGDATDVDAAVAISRFKHWWAHDDRDPYKCYLQSDGIATQYRLIYMPWESFKWIYLMGSQNNGKPAHITVDHQDNLRIGPKPDGVYVVTGDFQRGAQVLSANGDIPELPKDHHDVIWSYAIQKYGMTHVAQEAFIKGDREATRRMRALERSQKPQLVTGAPLA